MTKTDKSSNTTFTTSIADDKALFRAAMQDVVRLPVSDKTIPSPQKPVPIPQRNHRDPQFFDEPLDSKDFSLEIETGDEWSYLRPGVSRQTLRRLKRGYWGIQGKLDLHGLTQQAAKQQLAIFLEQALEKNFRCVQVIHGKGLRSKDHMPVLKRGVGRWLARHETVLAFCQARPEDGGGGAVLVLLKR